MRLWGMTERQGRSQTCLAGQVRDQPFISAQRESQMTKALFTTLGPLTKDKLGAILPHEHVYVDLRTPDTPGYASGDAESVVRLMAPEIERIKARGITALVECTTGGVGRRADFDLAVSRATNFPIVVPTGNYREPWIPEWVKTASEAELETWMLRELTQRV